MHVLTTERPAVEVDPAEAVCEALRDVIDPDLGVNVVDLGFVRRLDFEGTFLHLTMTLTSAACPLTKVIEDQVRHAIGQIHDTVADYALTWAFLPPWTPEHITEEGREQLAAIGFNVQA